MNNAALKSRIMPLALLAGVLFQGCASSHSKQTAENAGAHTAVDDQLIVVPVLILSPSQNGSTGSGGDVLPAPILPDPTTRKSEPLPL
jgi:hypothetical protein